MKGDRAYLVAGLIFTLIGILGLASLAFGVVIRTATSPDGLWRVEIADHERPGVAELYATPSVGGVRRKLNPTFPASRGVLDFLISPTSDRVFYRADISSDSKFELWSVPITGGPSTKVNAALPFDYDVEGYLATSDGLTVVYRSGRTDSNDWKLYRARATGGHVAQISEPVTGSKPVDKDFDIAPGDATVVYLLTLAARELYSTPLAQPHSTRINQPLVAGGNVYDGFRLDGDGHIRFRADARIDNRIEWWLGHIGGGPVLAEVFTDGFEGGNVGAWR